MSLDYVCRATARLASLERAIARGEAVLKVLRARARDLRENVVPEAVDQLDFDPAIMKVLDDGDTIEVTLPTGPILHVTDSFHPKLAEGKDSEERQQQMNWIEKNGGQTLLVLDVTLSFSRGEGEKAKKVLAAIAKADKTRPIHKLKNIHYQTLKKFCRDRIAAGKHVPDLLGIFYRREAVIRNPALTPEPIIAAGTQLPTMLSHRPVRTDGYPD